MVDPPTVIAKAACAGGGLRAAGFGRRDGAAGFRWSVSSPYISCNGPSSAIVACMRAIVLHTPEELAARVGQRARDQRLRLRLTQAGLAARSGVALGTLKRFERTGRIGVVGLAKLAVVLGATDGMEQLFAPPEFTSLDDVIAAERPARQRGSRR